MDMFAAAIDRYRRGNLRDAEAACEALLATASTHADGLSLLADIYLSSDRAGAAIPILARAIQLRPIDAAIRRRLAGALLSEDRALEAIEILRTAIAIEPGNPRAHNNLGQALFQVRRIDEAIASFRDALQCDPHYAKGHNNLGTALAARRDFAHAELAFRRAIDLDPGLGVAEMNLAMAFEQQGRPDEAMHCYERARARLPGQVEVWMGRGRLLTKLHRHAEALESFDRALSLRGNFPDAHIARAAALRDLGRRLESLTCLDQLLEVDRTNLDALCNRAIVCQELSDDSSAVACYRRALELDSDCVLARVRLLAALIPSMPMSQEESGLARCAFDAELSQVERWLCETDLNETDAFTVAQQQFFYLSYQYCSNRTLLSRYRTAAASQLSRLEHLPRASADMGGKSGRFQLGIVSAHVFDHSVFNAILRGWLQCLDRSMFEISIFSLGAVRDGTTAVARKSADHFVEGWRSPADWTRLIRDRGLDALIYPEIGMEETTLILAAQRLAPVQFAAWGHPETSGLPTIDHFFSAELFEPAGAQDHYCERLVTLPNLGVHCERDTFSAGSVNLRQLNIAEGVPLLICPGVPFKYRPQDDWVLVEIARRLGSCQLVFFQHERAELSARLQQRVRGAFHAANLDADNLVVQIPWQPRSTFLGLLKRADVYLDTIGFSGFNTMLQTVEANLPCVTYEGEFMRGRLGSGIMRRLGLAELVAQSLGQYIDVALRLAEDSGYRARIRTLMRDSAQVLYNDLAPVDALANVLLEAKAQRQSRPPS